MSCQPLRHDFIYYNSTYASGVYMGIHLQTFNLNRTILSRKVSFVISEMVYLILYNSIIYITCQLTNVYIYTYTVRTLAVMYIYRIQIKRLDDGIECRSDPSR